MKKGIILAIIILIVLCIGYKVAILSKYHVDKVDINTKNIYNETLTIGNDDYSGDYIIIDGVSIANFFEGYRDVNGNLKAKYDDEGNVVAFYSIDSFDQYISILDIENLKIMDTANNEPVATGKDVRKYLEDKNIKNDIDLFKHIKNNYYFKNTIFTSKKQMKINYLLNSFVEVSLPNFKSITLIEGKVRGYILNMTGDNEKTIREIHIIVGNKQCIITLAGDEIVNNEFITKLLASSLYNQIKE